MSLKAELAIFLVFYLAFHICAGLWWVSPDWSKSYSCLGSCSRICRHSNFPFRTFEIFDFLPLPVLFCSMWISLNSLITLLTLALHTLIGFVSSPCVSGNNSSSQVNTKLFCVSCILIVNIYQIELSFKGWVYQCVNNACVPVCKVLHFDHWFLVLWNIFYFCTWSKILNSFDRCILKTVGTLYVLPICAWVISWYPGFRPQSKNIQIGVVRINGTLSWPCKCL